MPSFKVSKEIHVDLCLAPKKAEVTEITMRYFFAEHQVGGVKVTMIDRV